MQPRLSIIVPVYNVQSELSKCIDSILSQTFSDFEIILIDDGSTDRSGMICDEYAKTDNRIVVLHKKNGGVSSARNAGLAIAKGEYIAFVDSDDLIKDTNTYSALIKYLDSNKEIDIVQYPHQVIENNSITTTKSPKNQLIKHKAKLYSLLDWSNLHGKNGIITGLPWDKIYRRQCIGDTRFDENMIYEDTQFLIRLFERTNTLYISESGMHWYIQRSNSITTTKKITYSRRASFLKMTISVYDALRRWAPQTKRKQAKLFLFILQYYIYSLFLFPKDDFSEYGNYLSHNIPPTRGSCYDVIKLSIIKLLGLNLYRRIALQKYNFNKNK